MVNLTGKRDVDISCLDLLKSPEYSGLSGMSFREPRAKLFLGLNRSELSTENPDGRYGTDCRTDF